MIHSLRAICLDEIVYHFDLYNLVYSTTKSATLKRSLEFLQRIYSCQIITRLQDDDSMKEEYADFVLHKYLKTLDTNWLDRWSWEIIVRKFSDIGPGLEKVIFYADQQPWEEVIPYLTNLKFLLYEDNCYDEILRGISEYCPNIEVIKVNYSQALSDKGIRCLCYNQNGEVPCPALKELDICGTNIGNDGISYLLKYIPSIKKISSEKLPRVLYSLHKNDINDLASVKPYKITHLNLDRFVDLATGTDVLKVCVFVCPHLESLRYAVRTQEQLDLCSRLSELKDLSLDCIKEHSLTISDFLKQNGSKLLNLYLRNFSVSLPILTQSCRLLNYLELEKVVFECNDNKSILLLHNLQKLSFERLTMTDITTIQAVICLLSSSPNLKHLNLKYCEVIPSDVKIKILKCCHLCSLKQIDFAYSDVELTFVQDILLTFSSIRIINLEGCITSESSADLKELETLALALPNKPIILYRDHLFNNSSDSDDFYNDFDEDDYYDDYYDEFDDYDDENEVNDVLVSGGWY